MTGKIRWMKSMDKAGGQGLLLIGLWLLLALALAPRMAGAHEIRPAIADVTVDAQGRLTARIRLNLEALLAGIDPRHGNTQKDPNAARYDALRRLPPEELKQHFAKRRDEILAHMELKVDGARQPLTLVKLDVPEVGNLALASTSVLELGANVPLPARYFTWRWPRTYGDIVLRVVLQEAQGQTQEDQAQQGQARRGR
jgi:hypothetical protein